MLMKPEKKGSATVMVGPEVEQSEIDGKDIAAQEILQAIERKDARLLREALCSLIEMIEMEDDSEESEESED